MAGKSITKTLVWILMGMLILGLGGFGVTNLSGTVRSIGSVGESEIDVNQYARALQTEIRALEAERGGAVSFAQAQQMGVDQTVLARLISTAALDDETHRMGISIGDENLRNQVLEVPAFQGPDGNFDRDTYAYALQQAGLSEAQFEEDIRAQSARTLLQASVVAGVNTPEAYTDTLLSYLGQRRSITWAVLDRSNLASGLVEPSEEELTEYHQANAADFTSPETKRITYVWLTPDMIIDTVDVDEDSLREAYAERQEEFVQPERRLIERLAFADAAAAQAAAERIVNGEDFEVLVAERGLDLSDTDMGDVAKSELESAGDAVFSADIGDVVGPLDSPIGPALFRINAVLQAHETSYEEALPLLRDALAGDRARRVIDAKIDGINDLLAGGASIEDLASESDMELGQIDWHADLDDGIAAYEAFRRAAADVASGDYPEVLQLDDGGIFAMRLDEVIAPALRPLEEVRDQVVLGWRREATVSALRVQAEADLPKLAGGTSFEELGMTTRQVQDLTRQGFQPETPPEFIETVFSMEKGAVRVIDGDGRVFVLRLDDIQPPDTGNEDLAQLETVLKDQAAENMAQDLFQALANDIQGRVGIELDQQALNAVHANFQ